MTTKIYKAKAICFFLITILITVKSLAYEQIIDYGQSVIIKKDGVVSVKESITYDFGDEQRHGIYRDIPYTRTNTKNEQYTIGIKNIAVTDDLGKSIKYSTSKSSGYLKIKIGEASKTVTGINVYEISYDLYGALTYFSDHDELYWNFIGDQWAVSVFNAQVYVYLPKEAAVDAISSDCYTGVQGSDDKNCSIQKIAGIESTEVIISSTKPLRSGEGLTGVIGFPKNIVEQLEPTRNYLSTIVKIIFILLALLFFIVIPFYYIFLWYRDYKNTKDKARIVAAWFDPPKHPMGFDFTPAETACLVNKNVNHKSISATIIQLAQKGYLKIALEGKSKVKFIKIKHSDSYITSYEGEILKGLFKEDETRDTVTVDKLQTETGFSKKVKLFKEQIGVALQHNGYFMENPVKTYTKFQTIAYVIGMTGFVLLPIMPFLFINAIIFYFIASKSSRKTDIGIEKYSEAVSLKNFLSSQDDQLDFQAKNQMFFEKLLPYATAFGVEKIWAERFKDLKFTQNEWVEGDVTNALILTNMTRNITSGMRSASYAVTSVRSSSGFSSGFSGGHSGGGGGGGGGGSW